MWAIGSVPLACSEGSQRLVIRRVHLDDRVDADDLPPGTTAAKAWGNDESGLPYASNAYSMSGSPSIFLSSSGSRSAEVWRSMMCVAPRDLR